MYTDSEGESRVGTSLLAFKAQVEALMSETDTLLRENAERIGATDPLNKRSKMTLEKMRRYAGEARDILALGFVVETVECPRIECVVQMLSCPLLRMFACGYESAWLSGVSAPHARLEAFSNIRLSGVCYGSMAVRNPSKTARSCSKSHLSAKALLPIGSSSVAVLSYCSGPIVCFLTSERSMQTR